MLLAVVRDRLLRAAQEEGARAAVLAARPCPLSWLLSPSLGFVFYF